MRRNREKSLEITIKGLTIITTLIIFFVIFFIAKESILVFKKIGLDGFLLGRVWNPLNNQFGILPMILSTVYISLIAILIAIPVGVGCSIFLVFNVRGKVKNVIFAFVDMVAGIPSVIFGFIGLLLIVKYFENSLNMTSGECILAGGILLGVMSIPYVVTGCAESIEKSKKKYISSSLSLGVSKWYGIQKIILPNSFKGILSNSILTLARTMGETMAVMMVVGNSPIMPKLLGKGETIPSLIALEMGSVEYKSIHYSALYGAGLVLIVILLVLNTIIYLINNYKKH